MVGKKTTDNTDVKNGTPIKGPDGRVVGYATPQTSDGAVTNINDAADNFE
jgi:hypothetical protein